MDAPHSPSSRYRKTRLSDSSGFSASGPTRVLLLEQLLSLLAVLDFGVPVSVLLRRRHTRREPGTRADNQGSDSALLPTPPPPPSALARRCTCATRRPFPAASRVEAGSSPERSWSPLSPLSAAARECPRRQRWGRRRPSPARSAVTLRTRRGQDSKSASFPMMVVEKLCRWASRRSSVSAR